MWNSVCRAEYSRYRTSFQSSIWKLHDNTDYQVTSETVTMRNAFSQILAAPKKVCLIFKVFVLALETFNS